MHGAPCLTRLVLFGARLDEVVKVACQRDSQMQPSTMAVYWVGLMPVASEILPNPSGPHSEDSGFVTGAPACPGRSVVALLLD